MENPDKPTRRRSPKAKVDPPAPPLPDLLSGLPATEPASPVEAVAKPARKRSAPRKAAVVDAPVPAASSVVKADPAPAVTPDSTAAAPSPTPKSAPTPRAKQAPSAAPAKPTPDATAPAARSRSRVKPTAEQPLPPVDADSPIAVVNLRDEAAAERPVPRPRKSMPPSAEVQDALPLPPAPPWSSEAPASQPPRAAAPAVRPADASSLSMRVIDTLLRALPERHRPRWRDYLVLMRMDRPVGALLLLWPTWWALWFAAGGMPSLKLFAIFTVGVFVMRAAGCVINDYADHDWLDANVERTRGRPMAAGRVSRKEALLLFGGLLLIAFALVLFTDPLTIALSFAGAALAAIYPFAKRVTHLAQVVLGAAFGWSIPMAFAATLGEVPALGWLLFLANVLFSVIYDTQYAMVDRDEDIRVGSKSTAILFGDADRAILGVLMLSFVITLLLAGSRADLTWPWTAGVAIAALLFGWQQSLIRDRDRAACFAAFRNNNWVGFVIWLGLAAALWLKAYPSPAA